MCLQVKSQTKQALRLRALRFMKKEQTTVCIPTMMGAIPLVIPNNNAVIVFENLGYSTQEVTAAGKTTLDVILADQ